MRTSVTFYCSLHAITSDYGEEAVEQIKSKLREGEDMWLTSNDGQTTFVRYGSVASVAFRPIDAAREEEE